jgi:hypothetical protein
MEQVILEANRLRSIEQNQDKKLDQFNNRWTNSVSTTGIEVRAGDIISVESAAINAKGNEVEDTMEFRGITDAGFKDNEVDLTYSYYVNHTGNFTIPLPFRMDIVYNGYNTNTSHDDNFEAANAVNLRTRQLGEWCPENVPQRGFTPDPRPLNYTTNPQFNFFLPNPLIVQEFGNYEDGGIYDTYFEVPNSPSQNTGIKIQVNTTRTEGNVDGIIDTWEIHSIDPDIFWAEPWSWDRVVSIPNSFKYYITNPTHAYTPNQNTSFGIIWKNPKTFSQRIDMKPDGKRFYKGRTDFIGFGLTNFGGVYDAITEAPNIPTIGEIRDLGLPDGVENINWGKATTTTKVGVPTGFATPTDVAGILTDQLHSPQQISQENEVGEFVNLEYYDYKNYEDISNQEVPKPPPPLITTPTFKPITAGFSTSTQNPPVENIENEDVGNQKATYADQYRIWYNSVYWEEPDRIEALSIFKQFYYGADNTDPKNEINSGQDQQANTGDFKNQTIGKLGLIPRMLNSWETITAPTNRSYEAFVIASTNFQRFYPIRTNIKYTKATVERIAKSFKMIEKDRNTDNGLPTTAGGKLPTAPINAGDISTTNMAVKLDIGMYVDEKSQAGLISNTAVERLYVGATTTGNIVAPPIEGLEGFFDTYPENRRNKWRASSEEPTGTEKTFITTTTQNRQGDAFLAGYNSTMNADTWKMTDGQELPQIWVQSRWRDGLQARQMTPAADPNKPNLSDAVENLMDDNRATDDMPYPNGYSVAELQERFERNWTDPETGEVYSYNDYIKWAIDADVALMPYFAQANDGTWGDVPYIAFLIFDRLGDNGGGFPPLLRPFAIARASMPYGEFFGFDCSYTRNKAVFLQNTQKYEEMKASDYALQGNGITNIKEIEASPLAMIGASNIVVNFDAIKSRFEVKGLHTPFTIGNPFLNTPFSTKTATDNPEQVIYSIGRRGCNYFVYSKSDNPATEAYPFGTNEGTSIDGYNNFQDLTSIIDAYSGIAIESLTITKPTGETQLIGEYNDLNAFFFANTLLNKMGFELQQLLPPVGNVQSRFDNALFTDPLTSPYNAEYTRAVKPLTTSSYISSAEYQPSATDFNRFPLYNLGTAQDIQAEPSVVSGSLLAKNLPSKLDFPYLMVYSNLGNEMLYYGGNDAHSRLPCLAYISRNYSAGDFFYMPAGSFNLTASKDFVLTDITTDIRLPDGSRPRLSPHSSVIYKLIRQQPQQPVAPVVGNEPKGNKAKLLNIA